MTEDARPIEKKGYVGDIFMGPTEIKQFDFLLERSTLQLGRTHYAVQGFGFRALR